MNDDAARRRYRRLLRIAPARLRDRHAGEMEEAFLQALSHARSAGRLATAITWARAAADLTLSALRARFDAIPFRRPSP